MRKNSRNGTNQATTREASKVLSSKAKPVVNTSEVALSLLRWFPQAARDLPWRRTADPYAIWISEIMLQQTQVKTVIGYWTRWMRKFPDVTSLANARPQQVLKLWEGLGYYARARNAHSAAREIARRFGGRFPTRFEEILALPGVGRYTAGAISSIAFNQPHPILDGNAARVLSRIFGIKDDPKDRQTNARLWNLAQELVEIAAATETAHHENNLRKSEASPLAFSNRPCSALNQAIMELGATICAPVAPNCNVCPVASACRARASGDPESFPLKKRAVAITRRRFAAFIVQSKDRFLVRRRPASGVNPNFWEFPNVEFPADQSAPDDALHPFSVSEASPCCKVAHTITRYRIELLAYRAALSAKVVEGEIGVWKTAAELRRMPLVNAHRRITGQLKEFEA